MSEIMAAVTSSTARRALVAVSTALTVILNKKLGLGLESQDTFELIALAIAYITGSNIKEAHVAGKEAAAKVVTIGDAKAVLAEPAPVAPEAKP